MAYIAIVEFDANNRVKKYEARFENGVNVQTEAEATTHVSKVLTDFPDAFVAPDLGGGFSDWLVNPGAKTLSLSPLPKPPQISDQDRAEFEIRSNKAWLALGRIATGNDALTEDALVVLARSKLP